MDYNGDGDNNKNNSSKKSSDSTVSLDGLGKTCLKYILKQEQQNTRRINKWLTSG